MFFQKKKQYCFPRLFKFLTKPSNKISKDSFKHLKNEKGPPKFFIIFLQNKTPEGIRSSLNFLTPGASEIILNQLKNKNLVPPRFFHVLAKVNTKIPQDSFICFKWKSLGIPQIQWKVNINTKNPWDSLMFLQNKAPGVPEIFWNSFKKHTPEAPEIF